MGQPDLRTAAFPGVVLIVAAAVLLSSPLLAQTSAPAPQSAPAKTPAYDVVSVKPHKDIDGSMWWRSAPDGMSASGIHLENLIMSAYGLIVSDQIVGLPGWADSATFDIQAKMGDDTFAALQKLPRKERYHQQDLMLQSLLADRFQLKIHHETRQLPVYDLVIAKDGLKMQPAPAGEHGSWSTDNGRFNGKAVPLDSFVFSLSNEVGRLVVNKTGLTGNYTIALKWTPFDQQGQADSGPSIFAALEQQLGLKLVSAKGPVDTIVVDHVEKPSPN